MINPIPARPNPIAAAPEGPSRSLRHRPSVFLVGRYDPRRQCFPRPLPTAPQPAQNLSTPILSRNGHRQRISQRLSSTPYLGKKVERISRPPHNYAGHGQAHHARHHLTKKNGRGKRGSEHPCEQNSYRQCQNDRDCQWELPGWRIVESLRGPRGLWSLHRTAISRNQSLSRRLDPHLQRSEDRPPHCLHVRSQHVEVISRGSGLSDCLLSY